MDKYSPKGNLTQKAAEQFGKVFEREIKGGGKVPNPASARPILAGEAQAGHLGAKAEHDRGDTDRLER